jgi:hypothetical protein
MIKIASVLLVPGLHNSGPETGRASGKASILNTIEFSKRTGTRLAARTGSERYMLSSAASERVRSFWPAIA